MLRNDKIKADLHKLNNLNEVKILKIPQEAQQIITQLNTKGYEAYIVGGCVRDHLLGKEPKDYDITTSAQPEAVKSIFSHTIDTGIQHGTVTVMINHIGYEVTTYRIDGEYKDNRHPEEVIFTDKLSGDLSRRDFTMNAIAYNDEKGFVDLFGGISDIQNKTIKGVGEPSKRFQEDALRMLRALRFSAQLNFDIEKNTFKAICENAQLIKNISRERIRDEFLKLLCSPNPEKITLLQATGLMQYILPELLNIINTNTISNISKCPEDTVLRLSILYKDFEPKKVSTILKDLRLDNNTISQVNVLVKYLDYSFDYTPYSVRFILSKTSASAFNQLIKLKSILYEDFDCLRIINVYNDIIKNNDCYNLQMLDLNGNDLQALGYKGKAIGEKLHQALDIVLRQPDKNNKTYLLSTLEVQ